MSADELGWYISIEPGRASRGYLRRRAVGPHVHCRKDDTLVVVYLGDQLHVKYVSEIIPNVGDETRLVRHIKDNKDHYIKRYRDAFGRRRR